MHENAFNTQGQQNNLLSKTNYQPTPRSSSLVPHLFLNCGLTGKYCQMHTLFVAPLANILQLTVCSRKITPGQHDTAWPCRDSTRSGHVIKPSRELWPSVCFLWRLGPSSDHCWRLHGEEVSPKAGGPSALMLKVRLWFCQTFEVISFILSARTARQLDWSTVGHQNILRMHFGWMVHSTLHAAC